MAMYVLYNADGSIYSSQQIYSDPKRYEGFLDDAGKTARIKVEGYSGLAPPERWYVDTTALEVVERPSMEVIVTKTIIQCGDQDSAIFRGMPKMSKVTVWFQETPIWPEFVLDATELEISIPVPATYRVQIDYWPYKTYYQDIRAVS